MREGSGHIEWINGGCFLRYRETVPDSKGRPRRRQRRVRLGDASSFRSESAARVAADVWLRSRSPQTLVPGPQIKAREYFERYLATHVPLMRRTSQRRYRSVVRRHLGPRFGKLPLEQIDAGMIQAWIAELAPKLARESVRSLRSFLLQILRQAREDGFSCHVIEQRRIRIPKNTRAGRRRREIGDEELAVLISSTPAPWWFLWALMGYAGLRIGEALGLQWSHIDLGRRFISVYQAAVLGELQPTKTETSRADVPILPELEALIQRRLKEIGGPPDPQALVFPSRRGTPLSADNVRFRILRPALARAGVRHCGLHAFRHGLPGRLLRLGASPDVVQRVMRHGSLRQTETYLHSDNLDLHAALEMARNRARVGSAFDAVNR